MTDRPSISEQRVGVTALLIPRRSRQSDTMTTDHQWTRFVRNWRDTMRPLFMLRCSRTVPCCKRECSNMAEHFTRTGDVP